MRPKTYVLDTDATGVTPWHMLDFKQNPFAVAFQVNIAGNTGTYTVEHAFCDLTKRGASISRSTTTATMTLLSHGAAVGDSVIIENADAPLAGTYAVASIIDVDTLTYTVANTGSSLAATARVLVLKVMPHTSVAAQTTSKDGNYAFPVQYVRARCTVAGGGNYYFTVNQGSN